MISSDNFNYSFQFSSDDEFLIAEFLKLIQKIGYCRRSSGKTVPHCGLIENRFMF